MRRELITKGQILTFGGDESVLYLHCDNGTWLYRFAKTHQSVYFKLINYIVYKLQLNKANKNKRNICWRYILVGISDNLPTQEISTTCLDM